MTDRARPVARSYGDVADFLRTCVNADEAYALQVTRDPGDGDPVPSATWSELWSGTLNVGSETFPLGDSALSRHIARHDPDRVLRDVAARRLVLTHHTRTPGKKHPGFDCAWCGMHWPCFDIRAAALPYDDRPGYREEWRP